MNDKYIGQQFGSWIVKSRDSSKTRPAKYFCKCVCGNEKSIYLSNLKAGYSKQCIDCQATSKSQEMIGKKYHSLTVISIEKNNGKSTAKVKCDCGKERYIGPSLVKNGTYTTCGYCKDKIMSVGKTYGFLEVISIIDKDKCICKCRCGSEIVRRTHHLVTQFPSCGCYLKKQNEEEARKLVGFQYYRLKVIKFLGMKKKSGKSRASYLIKCKCGKKFEKGISYLRSSKSCGCLQKENVPRGSRNHHSKTTEIDVSALRSLFKSGLYTRHQIAEMMGISYEGTCNILSGKTWRHVE